MTRMMDLELLEHAKKYTSPRSGENSNPKGWIRGSTKLEIKVTYHRFLAVARAASTHFSLAPGSFAVTAAHCRLKTQGKRLEARIARALPIALCVLWLIFVASLSAGPLMGRQGWSHIEVPSGGIQVITGPRPRSEQWPSFKEHNQPVEQQGVSGRWRPSTGTKGAPQVGPKLRINHDVTREKIQTKVSRLEKAVEPMVDMHGPVVEVLKSRVDETSDSFEETVGGRRRKRVPQVHHNGGEAHQGVGH